MPANTTYTAGILVREFNLHSEMTADFISVPKMLVGFYVWSSEL